ncbi:hypothetical protein Q5O14_14175 [Eubacteriaceae bacterium ES2]|nr:hypothetical protein Q5O14_14175 [Eubacteriaceae bacterium ES2]
MIITDQAKSVLKEKMKESGQDALQIALQEGCCGTTVYFTFTTSKPEDQAVMINGINVLMADQTLAKVKAVTIKTDSQGKLQVEDGAQSSRGCC